MPTPVRLVENRSRALKMVARPDTGILGCGAFFLFLAFTLTCWAIENGLALTPLADSSYLLLLDFVLIYMGVYGLFLPLGTAQELSFDKNMNSVIVKTRRIFGSQIDRYRLSDVIKVHLNLVDDGTFDKHSILLIFRGGGALQFPPGGGQPKTVALLTDVLTKFLGVNRSDAPIRTTERDKPVPVLGREPVVTITWEPMGLTKKEQTGTAPFG
jgi:hypothetical protein